MKRRQLLAFAGTGLLAGCGFQLRQAPSFVFDSVVINAPSSSPLAAELKRSLAADGKVRVLDTPAVATTAEGGAAPSPADAASAPRRPSTASQVVFDLVAELREKVVVGLNSAGQVTEFELHSRIRFRVRNPRGVDLIPETELEQHRDITFNEAAVLSKEAEESLLYRDMQTDLVQQLMRRLAAIRSLA
jgi:LPS-assembly lipoprotein